MPTVSISDPIVTQRSHISSLGHRSSGRRPCPKTARHVPAGGGHDRSDGSRPDACYRAVCHARRALRRRFFVGVRTTGIYCRPICPARTPKRENVTFFPTAAAAQEAGFRPCLRCRPETAPELAAWRGTSQHRVARAGADRDGRARRRATSTRWPSDSASASGSCGGCSSSTSGASPIAVAQTRRVLLAKQLIHETRLPMTEVALAAGFGSMRRFNETFQQLVRPAAQRCCAARRATASRPAPSGESRSCCRYRPPYDWHACWRSSRRAPSPASRW